MSTSENMTLVQTDDVTKKPWDRDSQVRPRASSKPKSATPGQWQIGDKIQNRYEVKKTFGGPGKSGMGIVYMCYDHAYKDPVAIKTIQPQFIKERGFIDRFKLESETWVRLGKHPNIVRAQIFKEINGRPYLIMEPIVGDKRFGKYSPDLSGWINAKGLKIELTLNFAIQFCHGMMYAEKKFNKMGKPFVHRDIKPANILISSDKTVKVTDFGLVKAFSGSGKDIYPVILDKKAPQKLGLSKSGGICGTPQYMSPEQCCGDKAIDGRSDIYSFGCVLYEMATGQTPFLATIREKYWDCHLNVSPKPPKTHLELQAIIMRCLEKSPDDRYQNFSELEKVLSGLYFELTGKNVKVPSGASLISHELNWLGVSFGNLGFYDEAVHHYLQALKNTPNDAQVHNNLGTAFEEQGRLNNAEKEYREALGIDPNCGDAIYNLGGIYRAQGKLDEAIKEYRKVLKIDPNYTAAHGRLGNVYQSQGKLDAAILEHLEALRIDPDDKFSHYNLGEAYRGQGKLEAAVKEHLETLRVDPNCNEAHISLGNDYYLQGNLLEAIKQCRKAIKIDPEYAEAYINLAIVYKTQGKMSKAIAQYLEVLRIDPKNKSARNNLGNLYLAQSKIDEAKIEIRKAIRIDPKYKHAIDSLGDCYRAQGKFGMASKEYLKALKIDSNYGTSRKNLGETLELMGRPAAALREFETYIIIAQDKPIEKQRVLAAKKHIRDLKRKLNGQYVGSKPSSIMS